MKALFRSGASPFQRFVLVLLLSSLLMVVDHRGARLAQARATLLDFVYPLQRLVDWPVSTWQWSRENLIAQRDLITENAVLRRENLQLLSNLHRQQAIEGENVRLSELLGGVQSRAPRWRYSLARIVKVSLDPYYRQVQIDKGRGDGVTPGQPLLAVDGVFGQVMSVGRFTSRALLVSDPSHAIPVKSGRNGLRAIAAGMGLSGRLALLFLPNSVDVEVGDLMVSSGLGGGFPSDYPVARVSEVSRRPGAEFAEVYADPAASLLQVHEVLLVWPAVGAATTEPTEPKE